MYLVTSSEQRHPCKAPTFSVNWIIGTETPEIINTNTGKPESGVGISQVCKYNIMKKFVGLCGKLQSTSGVEALMPTVYSEAKEFAKSYTVILLVLLLWWWFFDGEMIVESETRTVGCFHKSRAGCLDKETDGARSI